MTRMISAEGRKMTSRKQPLPAILSLRLVLGASVAVALVTATSAAPRPHAAAGAAPRPGISGQPVVLADCTDDSGDQSTSTADQSCDGGGPGTTTDYGDTPPGPSGDPAPGSDIPEVDVYGTRSGPDVPATDVTPDPNGDEADIATVTITAKPTPPPTCTFTPQSMASLIRQHEGTRSQEYPDAPPPDPRNPNAPVPHPTIGVGFNLDRPDAARILKSVGAQSYILVRAGQEQLNTQQINTIFAADMATAITRVRANVPNYASLSSGTQAALVDMAFVLDNKLAQFQKMIGDLGTGDFLAAAQEILSSDWAAQVGADRALDDASLVANCH
jgi:hypothetical protein